MIKYLALSMDGELDRLDFYTKQYTSMVEKAALRRKNYGVGLARVLGSRARSVLLVGSDVLEVFRPDLKLSQVRGVPFVVGLSVGTPVVAVPTFHPAIANKTKQLREQFEEDVKQWLWRGMYGMKRWPEVCVRCGQPVDRYDEQGIALCQSHWTGGEVPRYREQLSLDVTAVA